MKVLPVASNVERPMASVASRTASELLLEWAEGNQRRYADGYFERGEGSGYLHYSWRPGLITPFVAGMVETAGVERGARVLDFGCAKGFYIKILVEMGFDAVGVDISEYAIAHSPADVRDRLLLLKDRPLEQFETGCFDLTIAKDVLEHIPEFALPAVVNELKRTSRKLLVLVPFCTADRKYVNCGDELDATHLIRYTRNEWLALFGGGSVHQPLCDRIKRDKSAGTLCGIVSGDPGTAGNPGVSGRP